MFNFYILLLFAGSCCGLNKYEGWNYINLHCRNNENEPVDWWYLLKPAGKAAPYDDTGRNFSYIISDIFERWILPKEHITTKNMLQHTLEPVYRGTYVNRIAYLAYDDHGSPTSANARGLLLADELGGIFISHTVPNLVDFNLDRPKFPPSELNNGHQVVCVTMGIEALNELAGLLRRAGVRVTSSSVPAQMQDVVPAWVDTKVNMKLNPVMQFASKQAALNGVMLFRWPGQKVCLYTAFASSRKIVLDVYSPNYKIKKNICDAEYGVRIIDSISLKVPDQVIYMRNSTDRTRFAVSTAAHWQRLGGARAGQLWTCTSSLDVFDQSGRGGFLLCIDHQRVWHAFDNLKTKEPKC